MDGRVERVEVQFALDGSTSTGMSISRNEDGTYAALAVYRRNDARLFPSRETFEREGGVTSVEVERLVEELLKVAGGWYHHYRRQNTYGRRGSEDACWWSMCIAYGNGSEVRWEGVDKAPDTIDRAYRLLVDFLMPSLPLQYGESFRDECGWCDSDATLSQLTSYERLLAEARALDDDGRSVGEFSRMVGEFASDALRYVTENHPNALGQEALRVWGIDSTQEGLCAIRVEGASRLKMMALFAALAGLDDLDDVMASMLDNGVLHRWCQQLVRIPVEERQEQERLRREEARAMTLMVDNSIRRRISEGETFTSYDVARECDISAQQASGRIRGFVHRGELRPVGTETPRRYRAA